MGRFKITGPRGGLIGRGTVKAVAKALPRLLARFKRIRIEPDANPKPKPAVTMYDSVTPSAIPLKARAVAGYVNGRWATYPQLRKQFPHAKVLSVAVTPDRDADCLDVEPGDAQPGQAAGWVKRQRARGLARPAVYCSVSAAPAVLAGLAKNGIGRADIRLWTAHYTGKPHRCTLAACGYDCGGAADATQYTNRALGRNLDASLCSPEFF